MKKNVFAFLVSLGLVSCYEATRDCRDFRTGTFEFSSVIDGQTRTTTFVRTEDLEIDYYDGKADTSSIRWVNDCEYIVKKLHPKSRSEHKAISMKILTTSKNSYTFEFGIVGSGTTQKGTATKIK